MELRTDNLSFSISHNYLPNFLMGLILLGLGAFFYIKQKENWAVWKKLFEETKPSLATGPSALDKSIMGVGGFIAAIIYGLLTVVFLSLGIDQMLWMGHLWDRLWPWLVEHLPALFHLTGRIFIDLGF